VKTFILELKTKISFRLGVFGWWRHEWGMFGLYFYDIIADPTSQYCGSKFYWIL